MSMYRREWDCCGSITETDAWEPEVCPFCTPPAANKAAEEGGLPALPESKILTKAFMYGELETLIQAYARAAIAADRASRQVANKAEVDLSNLNVQTGADIELVYCNRDEEFVRLDDVKALLANHNTDKADVEPIQPQSVSDERKAFDVYWGSLSGEGATEAELEVAEHAAWWAWQARPRHCLALPLSAYPKGTKLYATPPATTGASTTRDQALEEAAAVCYKKYETRAASGHPREASAARNCAAEIRALKGSVGASTVLTDDRIENMPQSFLDYVVKNYPPNTIISDPAWHAPRLFKAAMREVAAQAGQVAVPEGFAIVPLEPTDAMKKAAVEDAPLVIKEYWDSKFTGTVTSLNTEMFGQMYKQMLAAAPSPAKESK